MQEVSAGVSSGRESRVPEVSRTTFFVKALTSEPSIMCFSLPCVLTSCSFVGLVWFPLVAAVFMLRDLDAGGSEPATECRISTRRGCLANPAKEGKHTRPPDQFQRSWHHFPHKSNENCSEWKDSWTRGIEVQSSQDAKNGRTSTLLL